MRILFHLMTPIVVTPELMWRQDTTVGTMGPPVSEANRAESLDGPAGELPVDDERG